jgi:hypothetical protein
MWFRPGNRARDPVPMFYVERAQSPKTPKVRALLPETCFLIFSSKVLKNDLRGMVRIQQKPQSAAPTAAKVMVLYYFIFLNLASSFPFFF